MKVAPPYPERPLPLLHEVVEGNGMGLAQVVISILAGGVWTSDGAELLLISSVTKAVQTEWDLSNLASGVIVTVVFTGILAGNLASGTVGDWFGRKPPIIASYLFIFMFCISSSFVNSFSGLMLMRFLVGASFGFGQPAAQVLVAETCPIAWRLYVKCASGLLWTVGELYSATLIVIDDPDMQHLDWRWLLRWGSLPSLVFFVLAAVYLPEAPAFLARQGHHKEAKEALQWMRDLNGANSGSVDFRLPNVEQKQTWFALAREQWSVIFGGGMLCSTLIVMYSCFILNLVYYGGLFSFPQVLPELFGADGSSTQLFVGALWEIPGNVASLIVCGQMDRKPAMKLYLATMFLSVVLFIVGMVLQGRSGFGHFLLMSGYYGIKFFVSFGFLLVYQYCTELYPPSARISGTGASIAAGRLAGMLAPVLFELLLQFTQNSTWFFVIMGVMVGLNLILIDLLPYETARKSMVEEEEVDKEDPPFTYGSVAFSPHGWGLAGVPRA